MYIRYFILCLTKVLYFKKIACISIIPWKLLFGVYIFWNPMPSFICLQTDIPHCWHSFLEELSFLHWFCFTSFSKISCFFLWMPISVFTILLHWFEFPLCQCCVAHNLQIEWGFQISSLLVMGFSTYSFAFPSVLK